MASQSASDAGFVVVFVVGPVAGHVEEFLKRKDDADIAVVVQCQLTLLLLDVVVLDVACEPLVQAQFIGAGDGCDLVLLHLVLGEALLHADAEEVPVVVAEPVEHLEQRQDLLILILQIGLVIYGCVHQTTRGLDVWNFRQKFLVYHFETSEGRQSQGNSQIKYVLLFELFEADLGREIICETLLHDAGTRPAVDLLGKFILDQQLPVFVVFKRLAEDGHERVVLIERRL